MFKYFAFFDICRTIFIETSTAAEYFAGFAECLICTVSTYPLHGLIPRGNMAIAIHGKYALSHGVNDPADKEMVPGFVLGFFHLLPSLISIRMVTLPALPL